MVNYRQEPGSNLGTLPEHFQPIIVLPDIAGLGVSVTLGIVPEVSIPLDVTVITPVVAFTSTDATYWVKVEEEGAQVFKPVAP